MNSNRERKSFALSDCSVGDVCHSRRKGRRVQVVEVANGRYTLVAEGTDKKFVVAGTLAVDPGLAILGFTEEADPQVRSKMQKNWGLSLLGELSMQEKFEMDLQCLGKRGRPINKWQACDGRVMNRHGGHTRVVLSWSDGKQAKAGVTWIRNSFPVYASKAEEIRRKAWAFEPLSLDELISVFNSRPGPACTSMRACMIFIAEQGTTRGIALALLRDLFPRLSVRVLHNRMKTYLSYLRSDPNVQLIEFDTGLAKPTGDYRQRRSKRGWAFKLVRDSNE